MAAIVGMYKKNGLPVKNSFSRIHAIGMIRIASSVRIAVANVEPRVNGECCIVVLMSALRLGIVARTAAMDMLAAIIDGGTIPSGTGWIVPVGINIGLETTGCDKEANAIAQSMCCSRGCHIRVGC